MNIRFKYLKPKALQICRRFLHVQTECKQMPKWLKPEGHETDITIYNPITKHNTPLILKNRDILRWYVCGPTVYDSAHIGHATTYVKSDIIRRILSNYFNIDVVMVMCITDVDDKIINRSKQLQQNFQELTKHYEDEFLEDMRALNVAKSHLYCRVTEFMPEIIQFVNNIVNRGGAYVAKDGCVYFDTMKYDKYGKLSPPFPHTSHPNKKSALDFTLWKAAKEGEPFWESPWGPGRPGWHIECSTIASTVFGNSIDLHSGGVDLAFPHHENEEAQSCCYHGVDQWVNYWLHCGHLCLKGDVKMSKSLNNTISIREFLTKYSANQFRVLCLLSNYRNGIEFSDLVMENAVAILKRFENFISDCDNYIAGNLPCTNLDEVSLLQCLEETKHDVKLALTNDFNTAEAIQLLLKLTSLGNKMLHNYDEARGNSKSRSVTAVGAVSNYISTSLTKFGITQSVAAEDHKMNIIDDFVKFRTAVRTRLLEQKPKDAILLNACDEARSNLSAYGVTIKDMKDTATWSIKKY